MNTLAKHCLSYIDSLHCFFQFQQKVDDSFDTSRLIEEGEVVLKDSIKTTDNYKALYHKIQVRNSFYKGQSL